MVREESQKQPPFEKPSPEARRLLLDGELLNGTKSVALKLTNKFSFAVRMIEEFCLVLLGQSFRYLNMGSIWDRGFSHAGFYADPGMGKDFSWKIIEESGLFPLDVVRVTRLDTVTRAALTGTISEAQVVPPAVITADVIFVGEFSTLMGKRESEAIAADIRALLETGKYKRRLAKVVGLKEVLYDLRKRSYLEEQIEAYEKLGMHIDLDNGEIHVQTSSSWLISSARFGQKVYGRPLLSMGDIDRFRWRAFLPDPKERERVVSEVGSLPPLTITTSRIQTLNEAWRTCFQTLREKFGNKGIAMPRDRDSYNVRRRLWDETIKEVKDRYPEITEVYNRLLVNLRSRAEFNRLVYQHAASKQFERDEGFDFSPPGKFIVDYGEDGRFAKQLWLNDYVPSMMDVIDDVLGRRRQSGKRRQQTLIEKGGQIVTKELSSGPKKREHLLSLAKKEGISKSTLDNQVLPRLKYAGIVKRDKHGWYSLLEGKEVT